jgi:hypothetical protein
MKNKKQFSKRQIEGMKRNSGSMSVKTQRTYRAIILLIIARAIKGKLGITLQTNDAVFLVAANGIHDALVANTGGFYTPAFASLALLATKITAFETAINNFVQGGLGTEAAKAEAKAALKIVLDAALAYVNNLAFLNQANAAEIITGANMVVITPGSVNKQDFAVRQGNATGEVNLISRAALFNGKRVRATYQWQISIDNGVTWVWLESTVVAKTVATGLQADKKALFRKRTITVKGGTSAWCAPLAITPV